MQSIELVEISKSFGLGNGSTNVLKEISLSVPRGEFLVIMGPSGSGKSTLLNIIGLLDTPDDGVYKLDGKNVAYLSARKKAKVRRNNIGIIFQNFNLISRMNVLDNVSLPLLYKRVSLVKRYERASEILKYLGIQEKEYYLPNQLSGGQLQRAAIARAMVNRPSIVLADEPTGNLDTKSSKLVMAALREIHEAGNTIIMVTHNPDLAAYGQRVIKMSDGRIEEDVTGAEMKKDIVSQQTESSKLAKATTDLNIKFSSKKKPVKSKRKLSRIKNRRSSKKRTSKK
ncbi:ABC transporter ATP-binding protein [Candidatus Nomurabacteria bacterium]|nr:ABC transporter ATP-binding protein [Candidatus Nomurabacteria bacterium]